MSLKAPFLVGSFCASRSRNAVASVSDGTESDENTKSEVLPLAVSARELIYTDWVESEGSSDPAEGFAVDVRLQYL